MLYKYKVLYSYLASTIGHILNLIFFSKDSISAIYNQNLEHQLFYKKLRKSGIKSLSLKDVFPNIQLAQIWLLNSYTFDKSYQYLKGVAPLQADINSAHIAQVLTHINPSKILEIGTFKGATTAMLAMNTDVECEIHSIDIDYQFNKNNVISKFFNDYHIKFHHCDSHNFDDLKYKEYFDLIFIDADHSYDAIKTDTELAFKLLTPNGIIIWDDYRDSDFPGVFKYINELAKVQNIIHLKGTSLAIFKKQIP